MGVVANINEPLVDEDEQARLLGVSARFLQDDRRTGRIGIPFIKLGPRIVRYQPSKSQAYVEAHYARQLEAA